MNFLHVTAGQVMLVWPHQMYLTGITAGVILMVASGWFNIWSMWILVIFYMERKNAMVKMLHVYCMHSHMSCMTNCHISNFCRIAICRYCTCMQFELGLNRFLHHMHLSQHDLVVEHVATY